VKPRGTAHRVRVIIFRVVATLAGLRQHCEKLIFHRSRRRRSRLRWLAKHGSGRFPINLLLVNPSVSGPAGIGLSLPSL
jgi:hypothetical protein